MAYVLGNPLPSEEGTALTGFQGFNRKAMARTWPCLSFVCHIRSKAGGSGSEEGSYLRFNESGPLWVVHLSRDTWTALGGPLSLIHFCITQF